MFNIFWGFEYPPITSKELEPEYEDNGDIYWKVIISYPLSDKKEIAIKTWLSNRMINQWGIWKAIGVNIPHIK